MATSRASFPGSCTGTGFTAPTIPNVDIVGQADLDKITGQRCTFMVFPWRWPHGDGCSVRVVAVADPAQQFRIGA